MGCGVRGARRNVGGREGERGRGWGEKERKHWGEKN